MNIEDLYTVSSKLEESVIISFKKKRYLLYKYVSNAKKLV